MNWATRLASELNANDQSARALMAGLTVEQLNWQPTPGSWSVGQCVEHLCKTNEAYVQAISAVLQGKPDRPTENITPGWFGRWFIRSFVEPSPASKRAKAPSKIRPTSRIELSVLDRFLASNGACKEMIVRARDKDVNHIRFWNPFIPGIRFTVGTGLETVSGHERRHLLQAQRVKDAANFPGNSLQQSSS
jgi:hypothetical protein